MMGSRKEHFISELELHYKDLIVTARSAEMRAEKTADDIRDESTKKEDVKSAVEFARTARAHLQRRQRATRELESLIRFAAKGVPDFSVAGRVGLGALVDVSIEDEEGSEERTLFILPVGAGTELKGPGGDGFISVITPESPLGRALVGTCAGDSVEIVIGDRDREWTVVDLC